MKFEVHEAVWLAAAIMTFEVYEKNPYFTLEDIAFKQVEIQKRAQFYTDKTVDHPRVNQWNNADHPNNTYNYLREVNKNRRITYLGEFNGEKEHPNLDLDVMIPFEKNPNRTITFEDLLKFIGGEYKKLFSIRFERIIEHLLRYANEPYTDPSKTVGEQKQKNLAIRQSGSAAVTELNKLADYFADKYKIINKGKSRWLKGSNDVVRTYLWNQLKNKEKMDIPTSISLFADHPDLKQNIRFRVAIELDEKSASDEQFKIHSQIIRKEFKRDEHYCYYVKFKNSTDSYRTELTQKELIDKVENGEIEKIQLVYECFSNELKEKQISNEQFLTMLDSAFSYLKQFYDEILGIEEGTFPEGDEQMDEEVSKSLFEKNIILYGPPGTGKTYSVIEKAVNIINPDFSKTNPTRKQYEEAYRKYIETKQIQFCTFHQSFSYEDFVEGLRSDLEKEGAPFTPQNGVFKETCELAKRKYQLSTSATEIENSTVYKISLGKANSTDGEKVYKYCIDNKVIALGHGSGIDFTNKNTSNDISKTFTDLSISTNSSVINMINNFKNDLQVGDIVIISKGLKKFRAIAKVTGGYYFDEETDIPYTHFREVEWLYISTNGEDLDDILMESGSMQLSQVSIYKFNQEQLNKEAIKNYIAPSEESEEERFVLIIDEINRGNISKIFGELITLIEEDKRYHIDEDGTIKGIEVTLPYSKDPFSVPQNVYLLGTMNTADRSISLMDTALRRRFVFEELLPNPSILEEVDGVAVNLLLDKINKRIEYLYDRDHQIGHAYFMDNDQNGKSKTKNVEQLIETIKRKVIPLLQEYFYDDWEKIELVLGGTAKSADDKDYFIYKETIIATDLFARSTKIQPKKVRYSVVKDPTKQALLNIYKDKVAESNE